MEELTMGFSGCAEQQAVTFPTTGKMVNVGSFFGQRTEQAVQRRCCFVRLLEEEEVRVRVRDGGGGGREGGMLFANR